MTGSQNWKGAIAAPERHYPGGFHEPPRIFSTLTLLLLLLQLLSGSVEADPVPRHRWQPTRPRILWGSLGKNARVGCRALLHGIIAIQGSNLHLLSLLHWQAGSLPLAPKGRVKNLPTMWETWFQSLGWEDPLEAGAELELRRSGSSLGPSQ